MASVSHVVPFHIIFEMSTNMLYCDQSYLFSHMLLLRHGAKTIKKNTNSTQNKSETHRAKQYEVTSFLSTDCELSTETCSKNVYSVGPWCPNKKFKLRF